MSVSKYSVTVVTETCGAVIAYSPRMRGEILSISYVKAGTANYTDGVDFTIVCEDNGVSLWTDTNVNASETVYPRQPANLGASGAASTLTEVCVPIVGRVKITLAQGGDAKTGTFLIFCKNS